MLNNTGENNMDKNVINFKLAMTDELIDILDFQIKSTKGYLKVCDSTFAFHKKQYLQKLEFFRNILTCQDSETFFDLTSGKPEVKEVI
tara:strand:+ start:210 stop:473 length:264 start_codon:yes stop_codon:yes gene_type:complete